MKFLDNFHSNKIFLLLFESGLAVFTLILAYFIRFKFDFNNALNQITPIAMIVFPAVRFAVFALLKTNITFLRYTNLNDIIRIVGALSLSSLFIFISNIAMLIFTGSIFVSNSVIGIEFLLSLILILGYRIAVRLLFNEMQLRKKLKKLKKVNVAILGASAQAVFSKRSLESEILKDKTYRVSGFIDNRNSGKQIEGVLCYRVDELEDLIEKEDVKFILVAEKSMHQKYKNIIEKSAEDYGVEIVESFGHGQSIELKQNANRKIDLNKLLRREPVEIDVNNIHRQLSGQIILVTGAAGSIGSEICRQVNNFNPKKIILVDQAETPLFDIENELRSDPDSSELEIYIADVVDDMRMGYIFDKAKPDVVFHAAAYKHVPMMENNPREAIKTNILGTINVTKHAVLNGCDKFVLISTDKAVNPTNVMGASKRIAEMIIRSMHNDEKIKTQFVTTRFGNVLGSNGSVIPSFTKQLEDGGPIKVTHPDITRYFMTIPEACRLVLEAGSMGEGGEIYIFDMGDPVKIVDLAKDFIIQSGYVPEEDVQIKFIGLRPGEKLFEELLANKETTIPTHHEKIMIAKIPEEDYVKTNYLILDLITATNSEEIEDRDLVKKMKNIVPEFKSANSRYEELDKSDKIKLPKQ